MNSKAYSSLPVYKNSLALRDLSDALGHYFSSDKRTYSKKTLGLRTIIAESIMKDASLIPVTIEKAYMSTSVNQRMQNAGFINIITRNIISYCNGLEKDGVKEKEYISLLRKELRTFRKSFKQWRSSLLDEGI